MVERGGEAHEAHNDVLVGGLFMCQGEKGKLNGYLYKFAGGGTITGKEAWETFIKLSDSHPEWSNEETATAMAEAGARYGPKEKTAFLRQANIAALEPFLGKLQVVATDFHFREKSRDGVTSEMNWVISVEAQGSSNAKRTYNLFFEPFKGKLYLISSWKDLSEPQKPRSAEPGRGQR